VVVVDLVWPDLFLVRFVWLMELAVGLSAMLIAVGGWLSRLLVVSTAGDVLLVCKVMLSGCAHVVRVTRFAAGARVVVSRFPLLHPCPPHSVARRLATNLFCCSSLFPFGFRQTSGKVGSLVLRSSRIWTWCVGLHFRCPFACRASLAKFVCL
jgi:hypothetical protein